MPVTAAIKFTQGVTTDVAGRALIGATGAAVVMTNGDNTDVFDWTWELLTKPSASAIPVGTITAGAVPSAGFTPDVVGSYLARLTVKDTAGNQAQDTRAFIVREGSGRIVPPFRGDFASLNYGGQVEGWDPAMESWLHALDGRQPLVNAGTGALNNVASSDLVDLTAAEGIRFTNAVGPTVNGIASGYSGRRLYVMATTSQVILANENAGSLAANRIVTGTGSDAILQAGSIVMLVYDGASLRWRLHPMGAPIPSTALIQEIAFSASDKSTALAVFARAGGRKIDMAGYPATVAGLARHVQFRVDVQKTAGATSVEVQLFDVTNAAQVSALLHAADNTLTELSSGDLTVGAIAGNIRDDVAAMYEVSVRMNGGVPGDQVFFTNARVVIFYS